MGRRPAGRDRARLARLAEFDVAGLPTTIPALRDVLRSDEFQSGRYSTSFLEDAGSRLPALAGVMAGRRAARRAALTMLYRWDVAGEPLAPQGEVDPFSIETAEAVAARAEELDRRIDEAAIGWTADRMGAGEEMSYAWGSTSSRPGRCRGRDQRGGEARQAVRVERSREVRERDPRSRREGACTVSAEESLKRAEDLLEKLEAARARLESTDDPDAAIEVLAELSDLAREVEAELTRAKREADAPG